MEALRRALEQVDAPPFCAACNLSMAWFRSELQEGGRSILHVFQCPRCHARGEMISAVDVPSGKS